LLVERTMANPGTKEIQDALIITKGTSSKSYLFNNLILNNVREAAKNGDSSLDNCIDNLFSGGRCSPEAGLSEPLFEFYRWLDHPFALRLKGKATKYYLELPDNTGAGTVKLEKGLAIDSVFARYDSSGKVTIESFFEKGYSKYENGELAYNFLKSADVIFEGGDFSITEKQTSAPSTTQSSGGENDYALHPENYIFKIVYTDSDGRDAYECYSYFNNNWHWIKEIDGVENEGLCTDSFNDGKEKETDKWTTLSYSLNAGYNAIAEKAKSYMNGGEPSVHVRSGSSS